MIGKLSKAISQKVMVEVVQLPAVPLKAIEGALKGAEQGMAKVTDDE